MWRKEQHFIATQKHSNNTHFLDNGGGIGPWYEKQISKRTSSRKPGQAECYDGCRMYGGHEFDIFGSNNISVLSSDDEQWHSMRQLDTINTTTTIGTAAYENQFSSSPCRTNKLIRTLTVTQHHPNSMKTNAMKRKTYLGDRSTFGIVEKKIKRCCLPATTTDTALDTNSYCHSRPSVLRTHFFLHTTPSGAPVDLFKPMADNSNCFCTQHTIYS